MRKILGYVLCLLLIGFTAYAGMSTLFFRGTSAGGGCTACDSSQTDLFLETSDSNTQNLTGTGGCSSCVDNTTMQYNGFSGGLDAGYNASGLACGFSSDAFKFTSDGSTQYSYVFRETMMQNATEFYQTLYVYFDDISGLTNTEFIRITHYRDGTSGANEGGIRIYNNGGTLEYRLYRNDSGTTTTVYAGLAEDTCYRFQVYADTNEAPGSDIFQGRLYYWSGSAWTELTSGWTGWTNLDWTVGNGFAEGGFGNYTNSTLDSGDVIIIDCIAVDDDTSQY